MFSYTKIKDQIKQNFTLQEIIEYYIGNCIGRNGRYKCPFNTSEEHHNLEVKGKKWHCYACGETGDQIEFVKKLFNLHTYKEALEKIAHDLKLETNFENDSEYLKNMKLLREQREKEKQYKIYVNNKENEFYAILINKRNLLEKQLDKVKPKYNALGNYRYTDYASEYIKIEKKLWYINYLIEIMLKNDVDLETYYLYNINMEEKDYRTKLKYLVVLRYIENKITI